MSSNQGGRVVVNRAEVQRLLEGSEVARDLGRRAEAGVQEGKRLAPTSPHGSEGNPSGAMRSGIHWDLGRDGDGLYADMISDADYSLYVEFGTRPHSIDVRDASVLTNGSEFFGRHVDHPGTDAQPFIRPMLDAALRANG